MSVLVQFVNFNANSELKEFVQKKVGLLERFHTKIIDIEVFLKVQKTMEKENKQTDIKVKIPGKGLIVKKETKTFEEGIILSVESMKRQLKKYK